MALFEISQKKYSEVVGMDGREKISVIIPVYNTAAYLERCLKSVMENTYKNLEIICVNDGSTDNSLDILNILANRDNRIFIIDKENEGVSEARNAGLRIATGEYIAFIDSDDWVHPQYFEMLMKAIITSQADIAVCQYESVSQVLPFSDIDEKCIDSKVIEFEDAIKIGYVKRIVWGRVYAKKVVGRHSFVKGMTWGEDSVFNVGLVRSESMKIVLISEKMYYYYQRETSAVHTTNIIDRVAVAKWYLENISGCVREKKIFIEEGVKYTLSAKYESIVDSGKFMSFGNEEMRALSCDYKKLLKNSKIFTSKETLKYRILLSFPQIYRLYRIHDDKSLLVWEKNRKKN